jgi:hypothetical protein
MTLEAARTADARGDVAEAAGLYESAITGEAAKQVDVWIDLIILYWQATDYGFWKGTGLDPRFVALAGKRSGELLDGAAAAFPAHVAVEFWRRYIRWADLGEPFEPSECRAMLQSQPSYLDPALFLFSTTHGRECVAEATALLRSCEDRRTSRCRYIASVIEAGLKRMKGAKKD